MSLLDEVMDRFADTLDAELMADSKHNKFSEALNSFCEESLTSEQAEKLNEIAGQLTSAIFRTAVRTGMRFGARLTAELLIKTGDDKNVQ